MGDVKKSLGPGDYIAIPPGVPHIFEFEEDTVMAEWWEPGEFEALFYEPYRPLVDASFDRTKTKGVFTRLVAYEPKGRLHATALLGAFVAGILASSAWRSARR